MHCYFLNSWLQIKHFNDCFKKHPHNKACIHSSDTCTSNGTGLP